MKCCICNKEFKGYGNSPYPVVKDNDAVCCDECNFKKVIPARARLTGVNLVSVRELFPSDTITGCGFNEVLVVDGGFVNIRNKDTNVNTLVGPFKYIDDYHFDLNGTVYHCDQYAEMLYRNNCIPTY